MENTLSRKVSDSIAETMEIIQPADVNAYGTLFGGRLLEWVDKTAAIAAYRHTRCKVVTMSIDSLVFRSSPKIGTLLIFRASVNRTFHTSLEVGVKVTCVDPGRDDETPVCPAYLTFVSMGSDGKPAPVPEALPVTDEEKRRWKGAGLRREARLALQERLEKS